jgi:peptidyl-prolyl cis-trans isomerase SurA
MSSRFNLLKSLTLLALMLVGLKGLSQTPLIIEKVVARVGSEYILYSDIQELYSYAQERNPGHDETLQCTILEQLIAKKMLLDQAKLDSIEVSDIEIDVELSRRIDYILGQMGGDEDLFYEYYGRTPVEQRELMREPLREDMIQQRIQTQLISDVTITPKEVVEFYKSIPQDSIPYQNAEVELAELSIKTLISDEARTEALEKAKDLLHRVTEGGEPFEDIASVYSDDPGSARVGGDLGWSRRGAFVAEFEAAAFALEPGEISDVVETQFGYHVIQLLERRGNNINVRHILVKPVVTVEDEERTKVYVDSIKQLVLSDSITFDVAVKRFSDDEVQSYNNAGRMLNPETGDTFWETNQLPYQLYFAIESLEIGEISDIVELEERGEKSFKVFQLLSKTKPHRLSIETDFSKLQNYAKENKKNVYFDRWMKEKIGNTFIELTSHFASCPNLDIYDVNIRP